MKSGFDKTDKSEIFRRSMNILAKLNCNVSDAYDEERAAEYLKQLSQHWHQDEGYVIMAVAQMAQSQVDAQLRYLAHKAVEKLQLPITEEEFRENWENLSKEKKMGLVDGVINLLIGMKKEG